MPKLPISSRQPTMARLHQQPGKITVFEEPNIPSRIKHIPMHPPRASIAREVIFLQLWQQYCENRPGEWLYIFNTNGPVRQRAASVAASFMVFMGCNSGMAFTHEAKQLAKTNAFYSEESAFLAAWALENSRMRGINLNIRTIEHMLRSEGQIIDGPNHRADLQSVPVVTMEDIDIIESMVRWWASPTAEWMRDYAEAKIEADKIKLKLAP